METQRALPNPPSALSRHLSVVAARERGIGAEQLPRIGTDPDLFDAFYSEHPRTYSALSPVGSAIASGRPI